MDDHRDNAGDIPDIAGRALAGFTAASMLWLAATLAVGIALFAAGLAFTGEEDLFLAPWWMRGVQIAFVAILVFVAAAVSKHLPITTSRYTGRPSSVGALPYITLVFSVLLSHGLLWGGLHHLHPGSSATLHGTVTASGIRRGKASKGHGDWLDLKLEANSNSTRLESDQAFAILSEDGQTYACSFHDTQAGDQLQLKGNQSPWGFAVMSVVPVHPRLLQACALRVRHF